LLAQLHQHHIILGVVVSGLLFEFSTDRCWLKGEAKSDLRMKSQATPTHTHRPEMLVMNGHAACLLVSAAAYTLCIVVVYLAVNVNAQILSTPLHLYN
jgi:hypothetical protein